MFWSGLKRGWAIAFVLVWLVSAAIFSNSGYSDVTSARLAGLVAAVVAVLVWFVTRAVRRSRDASGGRR